MHRGMAAQKATDHRRALAEVESNARNLRERQAHFESQLLSVPAASWPDAAAKARYALSAAGLSPEEDFAGAGRTQHAASVTEQIGGRPS